MCRMIAPSTSCAKTAAVAATAAPRTPATSSRGAPEVSHSREVRDASAIVRQKKAWARQAWVTEIGVGSRKMTVRPPRTPCAMTVTSAAQARWRTRGRGSARAVQTASTRVRKPTAVAAMRWPCS